MNHQETKEKKYCGFILLIPEDLLERSTSGPHNDRILSVLKQRTLQSALTAILL